MDPKQAIQKYEELKVAEREIKKQLEELQPIVLPLIPEDAEVQGENGVFYIQKRPVWKFSSQVEMGEKELKKLKEAEKANGTATAEYVPTLYYRSISEE